MYVAYIKNFETVHEVRYTCKQDKGNNKFWALKRMEGGGDAGQYTCIQVGHNIGLIIVFVSDY